MHREEVEAVLSAESECLLIQVHQGQRVTVRSPNQALFGTDKWYLFRRRHDAIRLLRRLAVSGRLEGRVPEYMELAFCPRDCAIGGFAYNYSGMPDLRGHDQVSEGHRRLCLEVDSEGWEVRGDTPGRVNSACPLPL